MNNTSNSSDIKICSINICGFSERSKFVLDKYADKEKWDMVLIQETMLEK